MFHGICDEGAGRFRIIQICSDWMADRRATLVRQRVRLRTRAAITERYLRTCGGEHANGSSSNAARAARNESDLAGERKRNWHSRLGYRMNRSSGRKAVSAEKSFAESCLSLLSLKTCAQTSTHEGAGAPTFRRSAFRSCARVHREPARESGRLQKIAR